MMPAALERMVSAAAQEALEGMFKDLERNLRSLVLEHLLREMDVFVRSKRSPTRATTVSPQIRAKKRRHLLDDVDTRRALPPKDGAAKRGSPELKEKLAQAMRASWARRRKAAAPEAPPPPDEEPEAKGFPAWKRARHEAAAAFEQRPVVVRIDGSPSRIALLVDEPAPGFFHVRMARGGRLQGWRTSPDRVFSPRRRRIIAGELVRDATPREVELGHVVKDASPSGGDS
jgi:hypothetical protein